MVNYLKEFEDGLEDFLDLTIYFNENEIRYRFQGLWTSSNFEKDINEKSKKLKQLFSRQLKKGLESKALLSEVKSKMREANNFLFDGYYEDYDNLSKSNFKIKKSASLPDGSFEDAFTYEFFETQPIVYTPTENLQYEENEFVMLFNSLLELFERCQMNGNDKPTKLQFENVKLLKCVYCYREILFDFISEIDYLLDNFNKIDFSEIELAELQPETITEKCNLNLSKIETAKLFSFLIFEKIMFIDSLDEKKNKIKIQNFIERHFNYRSLNSKQVAITKINREISEFQLHGKEAYNKVIDDFIKILESKKKV